MRDQLIKSAPPGEIFACHHSGWVKPHLLSDWFRQFFAKLKPSDELPDLSHVRKLSLIQLARESHFAIVPLSPHAIHKLQPPDKFFIRPIKANHSEGTGTWLRVDNCLLTFYDTSEYFGHISTPKTHHQLSRSSGSQDHRWRTPACPARRQDGDISVHTKAALAQISRPLCVCPNHLLKSGVQNHSESKCH
jgi:hypothetical protein